MSRATQTSSNTVAAAGGGDDGPLLKVDRINLRFGGIEVLREISFSVAPGSVVGIIGPNGAGKSSLLNCINAFYRPNSGQIMFRGRDITHARPHEIARLGVARTFQGAQLVPSATVVENMMLGRHTHMKSNIFACALRIGPGQREETRHRARVEEVIEFLEIEPLRKVPVGSLSFGQQRLVEIGRALAMDPVLLAFDEPTAGMNREEKEDVARFIVRMRHEVGNLTQIIIEHDIRLISDLCDTVIVLDFGEKIAQGAPGDVFRDPRVVEAYLGEGFA